VVRATTYPVGLRRTNPAIRPAREAAITAPPSADPLTGTARCARGASRRRAGPLISKKGASFAIATTPSLPHPPLFSRVIQHNAPGVLGAGVEAPLGSADGSPRRNDLRRSSRHGGSHHRQRSSPGSSPIRGHPGPRRSTPIKSSNEPASTVTAASAKGLSNYNRVRVGR